MSRTPPSVWAALAAAKARREAAEQWAMPPTFTHPSDLADREDDVGDELADREERA